MTFQRDLAWESLDLAYRSGVAHQLARYALRLDYKMLPENVVHQAKRCLLDALGCAIGAYDAPGRLICEAVAAELGGPEEATVFGSGLRTSAYNATLVNCFLVRFLDYNDVGGGGHNSDAIPSILAISEREKASGKDFLTSLVISYELGYRFKDSAVGFSFKEKGWCPDTRGGLSMPPALGKLMKLTEEQIANAIGICASHSLPLGVLDADREENTMMKNLRFGIVSHNAILACLLARKGFTGPVRVVEGDQGLRQAIFQGNMDLERLVDFSGWHILDTRHKTICANAGSHGHISATLEIVKEQNLKPEDIVAVKIRAGRGESRHTTVRAKKYPRNAETADHSACYANAIAIIDRTFGPQSFSPAKFTDPLVLNLIEKITVEYDASVPAWGGISEITTREGLRFEKRVDTAHGFGDDPLTDGELEDKFQAMALSYMHEEQIQNIFKKVWHIEDLDDMSSLAKLMVTGLR